MVKTYPPKKIVGLAMMVIGIVGLVLFLFPFWLGFIYPFIAFIFASIALVALRSRSRSPRVLHAMESLARIFLGAATATAFSFVAICVFEVACGDGIALPHRWDWLCLASLFTPQLLWITRFRASPLAALLIVLASAGPSVETWTDF